jgi:2-oxo-4-hydroxy-4-carboxy-5-ureidoimidazoline decarboxylase
MARTTLTELNRIDRDGFTAALDHVFEHSPWIADRVAGGRPFSGVRQLFAAMRSVVESLSLERQRELIAVHPDLANKAQEAAGLTAESKAEQGSAGLGQLSEAESEAFARLNTAYRTKFGFPYIVCARRHTRDSILRDGTARLQNDEATEIRRAIDEICRIAALRLDQLVDADDLLAVNGRLSTHVLDSHGGKPAAGIPLELVELAELGESRLIARAVTNDDGRTDAPLIGGRPLPIGRYELRFRMGPYFTSRGVPLSEPPFLDVIPIQFAISEPEAHYHVPLLVTPWSYSTYRGS